MIRISELKLPLSTLPEDSSTQPVEALRAQAAQILGIAPAEQLEAQMKQAAMAQPGMGAPEPGQPGDPALADAGEEAQGGQSGGEETRPTNDMGPRVRLGGGVG